MSSQFGRHVTENTHIQEALEMALEREKEACHFYTNGMALAKDAGVKELFKEMAREEEAHMRRIQKEIDRETMQDM